MRHTTDHNQYIDSCRVVTCLLFTWTSKGTEKSLSTDWPVNGWEQKFPLAAQDSSAFISLTKAPCIQRFPTTKFVGPI